MTRFATRWGASTLARRAAVSVPYVGALVAVATVGFAVQRKGVLGGSLDTGLNAIPYLGLLKNALELVVGDFIPDRPLAPPPPDPNDVLGDLELRPADRPMVADERSLDAVQKR